MTITVDGEAIPEQLIRLEAERLASHPDFQRIASAPEREMKLRQAAEESAINRMLMAQAAASDPRPVSPEEIERDCLQFQSQHERPAAFDAVTRAQAEARVRLRRTVNAVRENAPEPTEEQIREEYQRFRNQLHAPERVRPAHIVKHTSEGLDEEQAKHGIEAALAELREGVPFAEVADRHSDCPGTGRDMGWFPRGRLLPEFESTVFSLKAGEQSGVFRTAMGYHIAYLLDKRSAGLMDFDEARVQLAVTLRARAEFEAFRREAFRLRERAVIRRSE